ncbi:NADP-dependent oxidoreductase [Nocardioides sp.]|uniref:MDR family NADP-dependent oxidoreductase n=1 Tax=Nocardioides sp. TaxID=35761 RepID=UPI00263968AA|nr:NADP-dependent oxidoreductase [Nocardioides sp.]
MMDDPLIQTVEVAALPEGLPRASDFTVASEPRSPLGPGQVRIQVETLSLDPYLRSLLGTGHLDDAPLGPGQVMAGRGIGTVTETTSGVAVGTRVLAETGWRAEAVVDADQATAITVPDGVPASAALGVLGMPGLTAYAALARHLRPAEGETVVVSSATGGVGALAGQLARRAGARPVAIVGSPAKAALAVDELGYDAAVVRGRPGWIEELRAACPDRIHGYLHMGDQETLDGVVEQLAVGARVSLIGLIDQSNGAAPTRLRAGALMAAHAAAYGMVVYDHADLAAEHVEVVGALLAAGTIRAPEDRYLGLGQAGEAFAHLMSGRNRGKVVVIVDPASTQE